MRRNTPLSFDRSNALYARALQTIPMASQTFSKSALNLVNGASPLFLERGAGCRVWDVDGNEYIDHVLGLSPVVLGYCHAEVDDAIRVQLDRGISFSLATPLEAELAERLVRLIPCAEMVRFGKNGSDATSAAIRLARAFTGRDHVAVCGYHGWHDWYIGSTSRDLGVPEATRALTGTFPFNDADALERLLRDRPDEFAAVILEPAGASEPEAGFLERLRQLTKHYGVVLVFDEIVTGFRLHLGGAQAHYGVTPDLACFGKAMGNGMPISAIVGRKDIMRLMEDVFVSGTFGGEALSLAAAIATLDVLEREGAVARLHALGRRLKALNGKISECGQEARYNIAGPDWMPKLGVKECDGVPAYLALSLLRQELVANGLLMGGAFNLCLAHDDLEVMASVEAAFTQALATAAEAVTSSDPAAYLHGEPVRPVFQVRS